jgi:hypothetical protein
MPGGVAGVRPVLVAPYADLRQDLYNSIVSAKAKA